MLFVTTESIPGEYEVLGMVSTYIANLAGNPLKGTNYFSGIVNRANEHLGEEATKLHGNGVIGIRYTLLPANALLVTGTAIRIKE